MQITFYSYQFAPLAGSTVVTGSAEQLLGAGHEQQPFYDKIKGADYLL